MVQIFTGPGVGVPVALPDRRHRAPEVVEVLAVEACDRRIEDGHAEQREGAGVRGQGLALRPAGLPRGRVVELHGVVDRIEACDIGAVRRAGGAVHLADLLDLFVVARVSLAFQRGRRGDSELRAALDRKCLHLAETGPERGDEVGRSRAILPRQGARGVWGVGVRAIVDPFSEDRECSCFSNLDARVLGRAVRQCGERSDALRIEGPDLVRVQIVVGLCVASPV